MLRSLVVLVFSFVGCLLFAQTKNYDFGNKEPFSIQYINPLKVELSFSVSDIEFSETKSNDSVFSNITARGFMKSYELGSPNLPSLTKIIAVSKGSDVSFETKKSSLKSISIKEKGVEHFIMPARPSVSKGNEPYYSGIKLGSVYGENRYIGAPVVDLKKIGTISEFDIYQISYNPIDYNPSKGKIKVNSNVLATLSVKGDGNENVELIIDDIGKLKSASAQQSSNKYIIVSPQLYKDTLQSFIRWKKQLGFDVEEAYIGNEISSSSNDIIKSYLKEKYDSEGLGYVLLIGDVDQIPSWSSNGHVTDLYYGEFTGDYLPEVQYGRMSVNSVEELGNIIEKNLVVQRGEGIDYSYQDTHIYVAGVDANYAPVYCNGAVNYFLNNYANLNNGIVSKYYMYGSGSPILSNSDDAKPAIVNDIKNGAGIVYYTAHCVTSGWLNPSLNMSDINSISETGKYPLYISNCCNSYMFNTNSFGEEVVKVKGKGGVAYIGATDDSYWEEDYLWGVGVISSPVTNPTYEQTGNGAWDSWFHTHEENELSWINTAYDFIWFGNMSVLSSTSLRKQYYWEIYNLSGDPSIVPRRKHYSRLAPSYNQTLFVGQQLLNVAALEGSTVSLASGDDVISSGVVSDLGSISLEFEPLTEVCSECVELVVSHPDYLPYINSLQVVPPDGSYVILSGHNFLNKNSDIISKIAYSDTVMLSITVKNIGSALNDSTWVVLFDNEWLSYSVDSILVQNISPLATEQLPLVEVVVNNNIPNNDVANIYTRIYYKETKFSSSNISIATSAPDINIKLNSTDTYGVGNSNSIIEKSEQVTLELLLDNLSGENIDSVMIILYESDPSLLEIVIDTIYLSSIDNVNVDTVLTDIIAASNFVSGTETDINYKVIAGNLGQYIFNGKFTLVLGEEPEINMKDTVIEISSALFYDSGGPLGNYENSEVYVTTFIPLFDGEGLVARFNSVIIEPNGSSCYDKLYVYDGQTISDSVITSFCSSGAPDYILSQNEDGALTFRFISDRNTSQAGWEAYIYSVKQHKVSFKVSDGIVNLDSTLIKLQNRTKITDQNGEVYFENILGELDKSVTITHKGYYPKQITLKDIESDTSLNVILDPYPDVCFTIKDNFDLIQYARVEYAGLVEYSDEFGEVLFEKLKPGNYTYEVTNYLIEDTIGSYSFIDDQGCISIDINKRTAKCVFEIKDSINIVNGATVEFDGIENLTNSEGKSEFIDVEYGTYRVTVSKAGYTTYEAYIQVENAEELFVIDFRDAKGTYEAIFKIQGGASTTESAFLHILSNAYFSNNGIFTATDIQPQNNIYYEIFADGYEPYSGVFSIIDRSVELLVNLIPVGIIDNDIDGEIRLYPNPAHKGEPIKIEADMIINNIKVYDSSGILVYTEKVSSKSINIILEHISKGIIVVKVTTESNVYFEKIVVN